MPYKSDAQRRFMHAKHPEIAERWDKKYGGKSESKGKDKKKKRNRPLEGLRKAHK